MKSYLPFKYSSPLIKNDASHFKTNAPLGGLAVSLEDTIPNNIISEISNSGCQNLRAVYQSVPKQKIKTAQYQIGNI